MILRGFWCINLIVDNELMNPLLKLNNEVRQELGNEYIELVWPRYFSMTVTENHLKINGQIIDVKLIENQM